MPIPKPAVGEYSSFYQGYLDRVTAASELVPVLERQARAIEALAGLDEARAGHRYADGKWSVREVVGHLADAERIFAYRLLRIARGDRTPLAGFDEQVYVAAGGFDARSMADVAGELAAARLATLALVRSLTEETAAREGEANGVRVTARAIAWIIAGHVEHHLTILRERYGLTVGRDD
jgi:uncharacterized damage-inducible protein DinB